MEMMKSIGRAFAHIDVAPNTSVRIQEDFFNTHSSYHHLSQGETSCGVPWFLDESEHAGLTFNPGRRGYCRIAWAVSSAAPSAISSLPLADFFSCANFLIAS